MEASPAAHSAAEKAKGLSGSAFGIVGIETAFPLLYTYLVGRGVITLEKLIDLMAVAPRRRFGIPFEDGFTVWDLNRHTVVDSSRFLSMGNGLHGWRLILSMFTEG